MKRSAARSYRAVYEKHGKWFVGYVREVPGAHTQGATLKEARENLQEALDLVLAARRQLRKAPLRRKVVLQETISPSLR